MALSIPAIAAIVAAGIGLTLCHKPSPKPAVQQAQAQAAQATAQSALDKADATSTDHAAQKTVRILVTAQEGEHAVQTAQGAAAPVPADVLARWTGGLRAADAAGEPSDDDLDLPDEAVPAPR